MKRILNSILPKIYGAYFNSIALYSRKVAAKKAFDLFCSPRKGKVLAHQKKFLDAALLKKVEVDGVQFQSYRWNGDRDTVLLLHGWESNSFRWRNLISFLQNERFDIIALDAPAHGYSSGTIFNAPLYVKGMRPLIEQYKPKHIVAHSIGGMTALSIIANGYQNILGLNKKVMEAMEALFLDLFGLPMNDFSTAKFAEHIAIKGLLIHDSFDMVTPVTGSEKVHRSWKESTLIKTKNLGHSLHQVEVSKAVIDFLKS